MSPSYAWNAALKPRGGLVFTNGEGRLVLVVLTKPENAILSRWERDYPDLPIREGVELHFPEGR